MQNKSTRNSYVISILFVQIRRFVNQFQRHSFHLIESNMFHHCTTITSIFWRCWNFKFLSYSQRRTKLWQKTWLCVFEHYHYKALRIWINILRNFAPNLAVLSHLCNRLWSIHGCPFLLHPFEQAHENTFQTISK